MTAFWIARHFHGFVESDGFGKAKAVPLFADELLDFLGRRFCAEHDPARAELSALDALERPHPKLAVVIYGQGGGYPDLPHGDILLYVSHHAEKGQPRRQVTDAGRRTPTTQRGRVFISDAQSVPQLARFSEPDAVTLGCYKYRYK